MKTQTKDKKVRRHWQRPCTVECAVPYNWDDTKDRKYARDCIGEPAPGQTWHRHCLDHVAEHGAYVHQGLDRFILQLAPSAPDTDAVLETMTLLDKISAVRKLVAANAGKLLIEQQARLEPGSAAIPIGDFLTQAEEAFDQFEAAEVLRGRVLTHYALYGEDVWLVELTRAGDWLTTALAELGDALPRLNEPSCVASPIPEQPPAVRGKLGDGIAS